MPRIGSITVSLYREESPQTGQITEAICAAQLEFPPIVMDSTGYRDGESYRYASISAIRRSVVPVLARHGVLMQHVYGETEKGTYATTILRHTTGEYLTSTLRVPSIPDMQEAKAAKTLLCRTCIEGLLSITTEEDTDASDVVATDVVEEVDSGTKRKWEQNMALAEAAICLEPDTAKFGRFIETAKKRVASGDMPPDAAERIERLCDERAKELQQKKEKQDADSKRDDRTEGEDAAGGRGRNARSKKLPAGTGA